MTSDEQFEAWFASKFPKINDKASDPTDPVRGQVKEVARYAWKYSREAIEVELPAPMPSAGQAWNQEAQAVENARVSSFNNALRQSKNAIEAAGLRVKKC